MTPLVTPRPPQWQEAMDALHLSKLTDQPNERAYWRGVNLGYLAAFSAAPIWRDFLTQARQEWFAQPAPWDHIRQVLGMLPTDRPWVEARRYQASGVLFGYLMATAELPDAAECSACGNRILLDRDEGIRSCNYHGPFCDDDCLRRLCADLCHRGDHIADGPPHWWVAREEAS